MALAAGPGQHPSGPRTFAEGTHEWVASKAERGRAPAQVADIWRDLVPSDKGWCRDR